MREWIDSESLSTDCKRPLNVTDTIVRYDVYGYISSVTTHVWQEPARRGCRWRSSEAAIIRSCDCEYILECRKLSLCQHLVWDCMYNCTGNYLILSVSSTSLNNCDIFIHFIDSFHFYEALSGHICKKSLHCACYLCVIILSIHSSYISLLFCIFSTWSEPIWLIWL